MVYNAVFFDRDGTLTYQLTGSWVIRSLKEMMEFVERHA